MKEVAVRDLDGHVLGFGQEGLRGGVPMLIGAHAIIYSKRPEADRAFLRDVLKLRHADAGEGWLIFGLPPSEVAVHPGDENDVHELYLMCRDIRTFVSAMKERGIACGEVLERGWGLLSEMELPGGGKLGVYQPRHARPKAARPAATRRRARAAGGKRRGAQRKTAHGTARR